MAKRRPKKPTGIAGVTRITVGPKGTSIERVPVGFPDSKVEIEEFIVRSFERDVKADPSASAWYGTIERNEENDLDFDVTSQKGVIKLELTEIVPIPHGRISPESQVSYSPYDLAHHIFEHILKKARHYASAKPLRKILLVYFTDWRFRPSEMVLDLVRYWVADIAHGFEFIYIYRLVSNDEGEVRLVYPVERSWDGFEPDRFKRVIEYYVSPARAVRVLYKPRS